MYVKLQSIFYFSMEYVIKIKGYVATVLEKMVGGITIIWNSLEEWYVKKKKKSRNSIIMIALYCFHIITFLSLLTTA